jgi:hypothetical protein
MVSSTALPRLVRLLYDLVVLELSLNLLYSVISHSRSEIYMILLTFTFYLWSGSRGISNISPRLKSSFYQNYLATANTDCSLSMIWPFFKTWSISSWNVSPYRLLLIMYHLKFDEYDVVNVLYWINKLIHNLFRPERRLSDQFVMAKFCISLSNIQRCVCY